MRNASMHKWRSPVDAPTLKKTLAIISVTAILVVGLVLAVYAFPAGGGTNEKRLAGSLFISDAGQSHGGFEYTASYNVSLNVKDGRGTMTALLDVGLGDTLTKHDYAVTDFQMTSGAIRMNVDGQAVVLPWTSDDTVWNGAYANHYIASWGSTAPAEEIRGTISPSIFLGVPSTYYVELRVA